MVSKRLWNTIKILKDVAPRFGLNPDDDPHSTAALGMVGLAQGHMNQEGDPGAAYRRSMAPTQATNDALVDQNGSRIQSEMSRIFEGYVGLSGFQQESGEDARGLGSGASRGDPNGYGQDQTVYPHLREMF